MRKMQAGAEAASSSKAKAKATAKPQKARATAPRATDHAQWSVIPSRDASMLRLAAEPGTTIRLSAAQVKARRAARAAAAKDPEAHLAEVRSAT